MDLGTRTRRAARVAALVLCAAIAPSLPACRRDAGVASRGTGAAAPPNDAAPPGVACESLRALSLPHVAITEARVVAATDGPPKIPAHCRVVGASHPTADSNIRFVVAIPIGAAWTGRYQQVGSGGFGGFLPEADVGEALAAGNAAAGTDDGHEAAGNDARWALGHPEKLVDYGYRALKETTDAARAIVRAFTGRAPTRSYFTGCSDGGREALIEAQRFPDDFDGIVAQAPANDATRLLAAMAWNVVAIDRARGFVSPAKLAAVEAAALRACGDAEGIVEDPLACRFDPATLRCRGADGDGCLTDAQVAALRAIYDGMKSPRTGERIFPGYEPGAEAEADGWPEWITGRSPEGAAGAEQRLLARGFFRDVAFGDPTYDLRALDFDRDVARAEAKAGPILDASDPDLRRFARHGKLIVVHGWSDPAIPPRASIDYFERVRRTMGDPRGFYRLFLAPGMLHCGGGRGPNVVPALDAIVAWVERGVAPDAIVATKHEGDDPTKRSLRAWPLCVYPRRAAWDGAGDRRDAASWRCVDPAAP